MNLEQDLRAAISYLKQCEPVFLGGRTSLSLASGCELFMKYVTRSFMDYMDFSECKEELLRRGERFASMSLSARNKIAEIGHSFVQDKFTVLLHGSSRVVSALIMKASQTKQFKIIITEGRPSCDG
jgi:translation initiation factor eIF-2B subunit alpha